MSRKAILEFSLPEDSYDFELANKAYNFKSSLDDIDDDLRLAIKYQGGEMLELLKDKLTEDQAIEACQIFRDFLNKTIQANNAYMDNE